MDIDFINIMLYDYTHIYWQSSAMYVNISTLKKYYNKGDFTMSELRELFNDGIRLLPEDIASCLTFAERHVTLYRHSVIQINHVVYGCLYMLDMKLNHSSKKDRALFSASYQILTSCYTNPDHYAQIVDSISTPGTCKNKPLISTDLTEFANVYNLLSASYEFDLESFYLLLFYYSKKLSIDPYSCNVPTGDIEFNNDSLSDFLMDNINLRGLINKHEFVKAENRLLKVGNPIEVPYMTDLTYQICKGKISTTFIGRENELHRLINILCKKNKNNPILIGEPGVGKTALVYALAKKIVTNQVGVKLQDYHILEFDITSSISGARYRGDYEERINNSLKKIIELTNSGEKIIICIDEIHNIVGAGAAEGAIDLSAILKPFLLNSSIKIIGTSTLKDYRTIEADKALERRFDTITVNEPSFDETVAILTGLKQSLEEFHQLTIAGNTIESVVTLSKRYIPERFLPDKAIDLLDEACAIKANSSRCSEVLPDDISLAISIKKGIPIRKVQNAYGLMDLESTLNAKIIGQSHVIRSIATAVRRTRAGLSDENRPLASFMFVGPTGVGKTEVAKTLADLIFSGKDNIIRFDMSEYMEESSVSKLIGSSPGYVGYEEAGLLTEQVRRNPYSLVLFDEFEKAHPKICNILLQILDEGTLTDSKGQHINFKNTIIILTSNVGAHSLAKQSVGFFDCTKPQSQSILPEVKKAFSPEFLNRIDEIIQFNALSKDDIYEIAKLHISSLIEKVNSLNLKIEISDDVISKIAELGYSHEYGARELRRTIDKEIKNPLSDLILQNDVDCVSVVISEGQIKVLKKQELTISI